MAYAPNLNRPVVDEPAKCEREPSPLDLVRQQLGFSIERAALAELDRLI